MSLATRCASCGTVFRVVQDQLKVSEGWVRCGRCDQVFNALEGLFDLDRDVPPDWDEPPESASMPGASTGRTRPVDLDEADIPLGIEPVAPPGRDWEAEPVAQVAHDWQHEPDPLVVGRIDEQLHSTPRRSAFGTLGGPIGGNREQPDFADARFDNDVLDEADQTGIDLEIPEPEPEPAPEFVRQADREARWTSPLARLLLGTFALLLASGLGLQAAHHFRDRWSAQYPALKAPLAAWCAFKGCRIEAPRRLDDIAVESTALVRAAQPDAFRFSVVLHNRSNTLAATPWVDLTLTDESGQLVARRALGPKDFQSAPATLSSGSEATLQLLLSAASGRVAGYTVEIFYP
jgi:predicted Zn finger-like uncharacterized protein